MAVRLSIKLEVTKNKKQADVVAVANAGFESDEPEILIPVKLARKLRIKTKGAMHGLYKSAGGDVKMHRIEKSIKVRLMDKVIEAAAVISDIEDEVILNDQLISMLGIVIEDAGKGLWRLRSEPVTNLRESKPLQKWK